MDNTGSNNQTCEPMRLQESMKQRSSFSVPGVLGWEKFTSIRENPNPVTDSCCGDHQADVVSNPDMLLISMGLL